MFQDRLPPGPAPVAASEQVKAMESAKAEEPALVPVKAADTEAAFSGLAVA